MATIVQVGDIFSVRLGFRDVGGNVAYNMLHYKVDVITPTPPAVYTGELTQAIASPLAEAIFDHFKADWAALASQEVAFNEVMVQSIYPTPKSRQYFHIPGVPQDGAINEDALPLQDAPTLVKRTAVGARWGIGRVFVVGLPEGANNVGLITPAYEALLNDFALLFDDPITVIEAGVNYGFKPVLVGQPVPPSVAPRVTDLISVALSGVTFKTQRRRRPGKGI